MPDDDAATREHLAAVAAAPRPPEPDAPMPDEEWLGDLSELPPRPRRRLLTPAPLALLAVLIIALGFIGGVLVEKGQTAGSTSAAGAAVASRLRGLAGGAAGAGAAPGTAGASSASGGAGFSRPTSGTVSYVSGQTLYVTTPESNTVQVKASAATSVTKSVKSSVKSIHPGETVTVTGSTGANGTLSAESIRVGSTGAGGGLAGGSAGKGTTGSAGGTGSEGPALFGGG
ncbi:MAG: hypothetical protein JWM60_2408 [Solirubrobacterales bacterium]|nr:hypothetical protein [Solirubrobacterales bacterium]